jgi:predicted Zn-dependent protease with MMP-like domain
MNDISDKEFEKLIGEVMDELPPHYANSMNNVAITYEGNPSAEQRKKLKLRGNDTLFGLYEGVPLPERGSGYNLVLPDKITLFKNPLLSAARDKKDFKAKLKHTLWHELAHHFGLDHEHIYDAEDRARSGH